MDEVGKRAQLKRPGNGLAFPPGDEPPTARIRLSTSPKESVDQSKNVVSPPSSIPGPPVPDPKQKNVPLDGRFEIIDECQSESTSQTGGHPEAQSGKQVEPNCGRMSEHWLLEKGLVPGGPSILDLTPSFGGHVALDVWVGKERGTLRGHDNWKYLWQWSCQRLPNMGAREIVQKSGLEHLRQGMFSYNNMPLLSAFVERWQPDTNTFHMPFGEITITLHDVWQILKLPIEGKAITALEGKAIGGYPPSQELRDALAVLLGLEDQFELLQKSFYNEHGLTFNSIMNHCGQVNGANEQQAAGYILYLLGASVFVGKEEGYLKPTLYWLLRNINEVSNYAWGAGTLAWLYRQLGVASRADSLTLSGCLTLLECWIYEYFPFLRPAEVDGYQPNQPRVFKWKRKQMPMVDSGLLQQYRTQLDELTDKDVNWLPYGLKPWEVQQHRTLFHGTIDFFNVVEPYMPVRVLRQFGFTQDIPSAPISPLKMERPREGAPYVAIYPSIPEIWNTPWSGTINVAHYGRNGMCYASVAEYMSWYAPRTHLRISKPLSTLDDEEMRQKKNSVYERFTDIVGPWLPSYRGFHYLDQSKEEMELMFAWFDEAFKLLQSVMSEDERKKARLISANRSKCGGFKKIRLGWH